MGKPGYRVYDLRRIYVEVVLELCHADRAFVENKLIDENRTQTTHAQKEVVV